jgi:UDP-N-acetylglucosamine transferase subunit ALG13
MSDIEQISLSGFSSSRAPRVLVSPLDWGLGHATRVIPLIRALLEEGCEVTLASSDASKSLLGAEFPDLVVLDIPGYRITYPQKGSQFFRKMAFQLPRILWAILREHLWLRAAMRVHRWDVVVSDNRYGLFHPRVHAVILTHQVRIRTGRRLADAILRPLLWRMLSCFDAVWVPDMPSEPNLAGDLCHGPMPAHVCHIGPLSRFTDAGTSRTSRLLLLLSGPEPQRTIFESILRKELATFAGDAVVVRGLPSSNHRHTDGNGVEWIDHLPARQLQELVSDAGLVISRSGYSTVMDLLRLGRPAVLVPTPGQGEQEYLARHLSEAGLFPFLSQDAFTLSEALRLAEFCRAPGKGFDFERHRGQLKEMLEDIRGNKGGNHV